MFMGEIYGITGDTHPAGRVFERGGAACGCCVAWLAWPAWPCSTNSRLNPIAFLFFLCTGQQIWIFYDILVPENPRKSQKSIHVLVGHFTK